MHNKNKAGLEFLTVQTFYIAEEATKCSMTFSNKDVASSNSFVLSVLTHKDACPYRLQLEKKRNIVINKKCRWRKKGFVNSTNKRDDTDY